ncbi:MAG: group III truncated hemoglobin [Bacteroidota bacterium]|nr:group III truncated hemoglobin [Bacteroidota bacterium]
MEDIENRADIDKLLGLFYDKVRKDDLIGYIFNDIAKVDWAHHVPIITDFWDSILLGSQKYKGNPLKPHIRINEMIKLEEQHFERWLHLFSTTADELFSGPKTDEAKQRAVSIATIMQIKLRETH